MCWACHEDGQYQTASFRKCDGCNETFNSADLQMYDIIKEWKYLAEFIEYKNRSERLMLFCVNCRDAMDAYRESTRAHASETEPYVWHHYGNRFKDTKHGAITVGIHCVATQMTYGLRCAKQVYGYDATEEILQGFTYCDDQGHRIKRLTLEDVGEKVICDKCWLPLWRCNAREVSR